MKLGDLVYLKTLPPHWDENGFQIGDLAILLSIDWDEKTYPGGLRMKDNSICTGRGVFFFTRTGNPFKRSTSIGCVCLYSDVEVISE